LLRGFATWENTQGWDTKSLMECVGWKDVQSAMRYIEVPDPFYQQKIAQDLAISEPEAQPLGSKGKE